MIGPESLNGLVLTTRLFLDSESLDPRFSRTTKMVVRKTLRTLWYIFQNGSNLVNTLSLSTSTRPTSLLRSEDPCDCSVVCTLHLQNLGDLVW